MEHYIDLTEIDKKYKDKCSLIKAGKCKNVNIFLENSRELKRLKVENEELKEKLKNYEIQEDFNKCQKAQNRFVKEHLNGVFNNLRERDIAVIRGMNKIECKNKECEVEK